MPDVACIIQARRQSSRLPDKIFKTLGSKPALKHVIDRCHAIDGVSHVIVASPDDPIEDPVEELALKAGALSFRGDPQDVLSRYFHAHQLVDTPLVMRVTGDCPLIDPTLCSELIKKVHQEGADYGVLVNWPHGLDCEVFTRDLLQRAHTTAHLDVDREHVTLWMKKQPNLKRTNVAAPNGEMHTGNRWVLDYPKDLKFLQALFAQFDGLGSMPGWQEVTDVLERNPHLREINAECEQAWARQTKQVYHKSKQPAPRNY